MLQMMHSFLINNFIIDNSCRKKNTTFHYHKTLLLLFLVLPQCTISLVFFFMLEAQEFISTCFFVCSLIAKKFDDELLFFLYNEGVV